MRRLAIDDFIKRSNEKHNNKYIYNKTDLDNRDEKGRVIVTCPIHGDFLIEPNNHLRGVGCGKCINNKKKTNEEVIRKIKEIHGDKYIIPQDFEYISNKTPFHVICPIHGDFYPFYRNFITEKHGCKKCSCHIYTNDEFINEIKRIYGDKFNLDYVDLKGYRKEIELVCNKCGEHLHVRPKRLLNGNFNCECEKSKMSMLEQNVATMLDKSEIQYIYNYKNEEWLKLKKQLSLDFYIPQYNSAIECQGRFHFEPYRKNCTKSENEYLEQYTRDSVKYKLCKENGIKLFYFSDMQVDDYFAPIYNNVNEIINKIKL